MRAAKKPSVWSRCGSAWKNLSRTIRACLYRKIARGFLQLKLWVLSQKEFDVSFILSAAERTGRINQDPARLQVSDDSTENFCLQATQPLNVAFVSLPFDFGMGAKRAETTARRVDQNAVEGSRGEGRQFFTGVGAHEVQRFKA